MKRKHKKFFKYKSKIIIALVVAVSFATVLSWYQMKNAQAQYQTVSNAGSSSFPKNGYWTYIKVNGPYGVSCLSINIQQKENTVYKNYSFNDNIRTLTVTKKDITNENYYNLSLASSQVNTEWNGTNYSWIGIKVKYTVPAHYYYKGISYDAPGSRSHTLRDGQPGHEKSAHSVTTTIGMSAYDTGVAPYRIDGKYYRYHDCTVTIDITNRDKHTVYYNANGGNGGGFSWTFNDGDNFTFPTVSREGYTFNGWYDYHHQMWSNTGWIVCGEDYEETAQWTANQYNVSFDDNGADSGDVDDATATYDSNFTLPQNGYKKKGYKFLGWSTNENATSPQYTPGQTFTYKTADDTTFYAIWEKDNFEVKFHGNGSSAADYTADLTYNKTVNLPKNIFERPGYTFIGWAEKDEGEKEVPEEITYTDGQAVKDLCEPGETCHLYALWKKTDGSFETQNIIHDENMFLGDINIIGGNGTEYSQNNIDSKSAKIDKEDNPGYFTNKY